MVAAVSNVEPLLMTIREAAETLRLCERKIWSLAKGGEIPTVKIGRAVRFDPVDLRDWIAANKVSR